MSIMAVKEGDTVKVDYEGKLEDGKVFDASEKHGKPLEFKVGAHQVIKGFEDGVIGMEVGEEKEVTISEDEAYGPKTDDLIKKVPRASMPKDLQAGMGIVMKTSQGQNIPAKVVEVTDEDVTVDINHPLSGQTLIFKIKIVEVK